MANHSHVVTAAPSVSSNLILRYRESNSNSCATCSLCCFSARLLYQSFRAVCSVVSVQSPGNTTLLQGRHRCRCSISNVTFLDPVTVGLRQYQQAGCRRLHCVGWICDSQLLPFIWRLESTLDRQRTRRASSSTCEQSK